MKFLSRGKWDEDKVAQRLIRVVVSYLSEWVYVYDQTHATKTGKKQFGLHFFKNHRYRIRNTNQSKFHWGHEFAGLGVVVRTRPKKSKPYRYFPVYTTDLTLSVETIILHYKRRWTFETGMHDSKESFGFDHYQIRSETAIQRSVSLSFIPASLTQLLALPQFQQPHSETLPGLAQGLDEMNIHWYHPKRWTLGLVTRYIRWKYMRQVLPERFSHDKNLTKSENTYSIAAG